MKLIFRYLGRYKKWVALAIFVKLLATLMELSLPYIFFFFFDYVVPAGIL